MGRKETADAATARTYTKRLELDENRGREHLQVTLKRQELDQKSGLEHLGFSCETASPLTVTGTCIVVVSTGAWFVSQMLTDTKASTVFLQREMLTHSQNFQSMISGGNYPEKSSPEKPDSKK
ncbi:TPA: hypothetical protein ACH3X1_002170 [Trebouxia sp. C0004]